MAGMLLAKLMPAYSLREADHVAVSATPERAWPAARGFDAARIPFVRALFEMRIVPERIAALARGRPQPSVSSVGVASVERSAEPGFQVLGEDPGKEIVVGAIGRFWQPKIEWKAVAPEAFRDFAEPGWGRVAWCVRVDPRESGGSFITFEVRVGATDAVSFERFRPYWALIGRFSRAIRRSVLQRTAKEVGLPPRAPVAGDELIPVARYLRTHTRFLEAPPAEVWPWLVQMGYGRAGWYSFDRLDNGGAKSASRIVPSLQNLAEGDLVPATAAGDVAFAVLRLVPGRVLVLGSPTLLPSGLPAAIKPPASDATWAFQLEPVGSDATLLTVRVRGVSAPTLGAGLMRFAVGAAHEIMEAEQLRNLRKRVEARAS